MVGFWSFGSEAHGDMIGLHGFSNGHVGMCLRSNVKKVFGPFNLRV